MSSFFGRERVRGVSQYGLRHRLHVRGLSEPLASQVCPHRLHFQPSSLIFGMSRLQFGVQFYDTHSMIYR